MHSRPVELSESRDYRRCFTTVHGQRERPLKPASARDTGRLIARFHAGGFPGATGPELEQPRLSPGREPSLSSPWSHLSDSSARLPGPLRGDCLEERLWPMGGSGRLILSVHLGDSSVCWAPPFLSEVPWPRQRAKRRPAPGVRQAVPPCGPQARCPRCRLARAAGPLQGAEHTPALAVGRGLRCLQAASPSSKLPSSCPAPRPHALTVSAGFEHAPFLTPLKHASVLLTLLAVHGLLTFRPRPSLLAVP